jgi:hypothetical protein
MKRMGIVVLLILVAVAPLAFVPITRAASLGIQITVFRNGNLVGTAAGGVAGAAPTLTVTAAPGDTLRFQVALDQSATFNSYSTTIATDDPTEIDFVNGSGMDLSGKGFTGGGNPNTTLNDASPASGAASVPGSGGSVTTQDLYRLDYTVQPGVTNDASADIRINLVSIGSNTVNTAIREAALRVDAQAPEPASLLLLGIGLIPLMRTFQRNRGRGSR